MAHISDPEKEEANTPTFALMSSENKQNMNKLQCYASP